MIEEYESFIPDIYDDEEDKYSDDLKLKKNMKQKDSIATRITHDTLSSNNSDGKKKEKSNPLKKGKYYFFKYLIKL